MTIVDTHVTTIVSAAILFLFGTGPVKGFAVTLSFGLFETCSLRFLSPATSSIPSSSANSVEKHFRSVSRRRKGKAEFLVELFRGVDVDWLGKKWYFLAFSLVFSVSGVLSILFWHGIKLGVDFRGGTLVYVQLSSSQTLTAFAWQSTVPASTTAGSKPTEQRASARSRFPWHKRKRRSPLSIPGGRPSSGR